MSPEIFFSQYWGKEWLLQQGQPTRFEKLLSWGDIEDILARQPTQLRLVKGGALIPEEKYIKTRYRDHVELRPAHLADELRHGATLVLDGIDRLHTPIRETAQALEWATQESVQVNLYVSWGTTPGFNLHWDDHDVIIVHLHGRKAWKVCGMSRRHPVRKDRLPERKFEPPSDHLWKGHLQPGDLLYLPRGWWHEVTATAEPTAHLTFAIPKRTGLDFVNWLLSETLVESEIFRQDLPRHATAEEKYAHHVRLKDALLQHLTEKTLDHFFEAEGALVPSKPVFSLPWQASDDIIPPGIDLVVVRTLARKPQMHLDANSNSFSFSANGKRLLLPLACQPVVKCIFDRKLVGFREIQATPECAISDENLRTLLKAMVQNGLITVRPAKIA